MQFEWDEVKNMDDAGIDYSDIPPLTEAFFEKAALRVPVPQAQRLVQIDPDVLKWFQAQDGEYNVLINSVLRRYIESNSEQPAV